MSEASIARINEAIKACLVACYDSELPLACLKQFLDRLCADSAFNEKEVLIVSARVRSMLSMMFKRSDGGALLPIIPTDPEHLVNDHGNSVLEQSRDVLSNNNFPSPNTAESESSLI